VDRGRRVMPIVRRTDRCSTVIRTIGLKSQCSVSRLRHDRSKQFLHGFGRYHPGGNLLFNKQRKECVEMRRRVNQIGKHKSVICMFRRIGIRRTEQRRAE
jgi:hypothetical protein